jgi:hypothetical protein
VQHNAFTRTGISKPYLFNELERDLVCNNGRVPVGNVRKRACMDKRGRALERLHEIGLDRVVHDDRHRARQPEIVNGERLASLRFARQDHSALFGVVCKTPTSADMRHWRHASRIVP